jgi:ubiquitin C-terminal hydrolase
MILKLPKKSCGRITSRLRGLFGKMNSGSSCSVSHLINSFNWTSTQMNSQRDVHEFSREFLEGLSKEISLHDGNYRFFDHFYEKFKTIISFARRGEMINKDDFGEISIPLESVTSVHEGIKKFMEGSSMTGKNQFEFQDGHKEDANITYSFSKFPYILHIQLNRFSFDFRAKISVKITKSIQCPQFLNLKEF